MCSGTGLGICAAAAFNASDRDLFNASNRANFSTLFKNRGDTAFKYIKGEDFEAAGDDLDDRGGEVDPDKEDCGEAD